MYRIHRSVDVSFSHHVWGHSGPSVNVHGHTWKFEVGHGAAGFDREGFVVDFADRVRDELTALGVVLEDAPDGGTRWRIQR